MGKLIDFSTRKEIVGGLVDTEVEQEPTPRFVLNEVLKFVDDVEEVIVMVKDSQGTTGFVTNVDSYEKTIALIERVKFNMTATEAVNAVDTP